MTQRSFFLQDNGKYKTISPMLTIYLEYLSKPTAEQDPEIATGAKALVEEPEVIQLGNTRLSGYVPFPNYLNPSSNKILPSYSL